MQMPAENKLYLPILDNQPTLRVLIEMVRCENLTSVINGNRI